MDYKSAFQHIGLLVILMIYTGVGGLGIMKPLPEEIESPTEQLTSQVFRHIENPAEIEKVRFLNETVKNKRLDLIAVIINRSNIGNLDFLISHELREYERMLEDAVMSGYSMSSREPAEKWSYLKSVFFSSTVLTTIGYGNIVPATTEGRVFCMVFALIGIPLTLTVIADWGRLFASSVSALSKHTHSIPSFIRNRLTYARRRSSFAFLGVCFLFIYLSAGAGLFVLWEEDWTFMDGFYFCFITMTTIGFGDLVPSKPKYMLLCTLYILIGLALTSTIIELVRRQYAKSWKQLQALRGPLAENLRRFAENAPGLDVMAFQHDIMKVLTVVTVQKKAPSNFLTHKKNKFSHDRWEEAMDFVMKDMAHSNNNELMSPVVQMILYESSV